MNDISHASSTLDAPLRLLYILPTQHPRALLALSLGALLVTPPVLSYRAYAGRKASAGVYTSDVAGWLRRMLFLPFFRETRSTAMYDSDPNTDQWLLPEELPYREGERPVWDSSIGPQRQVDQLPSLEMREVRNVVSSSSERRPGLRLTYSEQKINAAMRACANANPELIQIERSPNETQSPGMVIHPRLPTPHHAARAASREVGHVHSDCEYSMHLVLAPQDCKLGSLHILLGFHFIMTNLVV